MDVKGCAAVVTGGGSGMGAAAAESLAAAGAKVTVLGRREDVVKAQAGKIGGLGIACDVSDAASTEAAFAAAGEAHGPVRILLNAAGIGPFFPVVGEDGKALPLEMFLEVININLVGTFNAARLAAAQMMAADPMEDGERGLIINVSSGAGDGGGGNATAYSASKGGVNTLTTAMAREFGDVGIRVNTISPGPVVTPLMDTVPKEMQKLILHHCVFPKRMGKVTEFASLVMHLCENILINSEIIRLDAGVRPGYRM